MDTYARVRALTLATSLLALTAYSHTLPADTPPQTLGKTPPIPERAKAAAPLKTRLDQQAAAPQDGPYTVHASPPVPYEVLNHRLQQQLFHQTVTMPTTFGRDLLLERATASDLNGRTLLALETSGGVNGTLYYWGTPKLEQDVKVITIPDLQMTTETKAALDEYKVGYWQTVDEQLRERLRQAVRLDLSQQRHPCFP